MAASKAHDLIVAVVARKIVDSGYELVGIESSLDWLFGEGFRVPPTIVHHRPDVLGERRRAPFLAIRDAKTVSDLASARTAQQLADYTGLRVGEHNALCLVVIGVPQSGLDKLWRLIVDLMIPRHRICVVPVPDPLLGEKRT